MGFVNQCPVPGASTSPLEKYSAQILALIREQRDLTLNEIVSVLNRRRIPGSRSALSRFFARHGITFKKKPARGRAQASRRGLAHADAGFASKAGLTLLASSSSTEPQSQPIWCA